MEGELTVLAFYLRLTFCLDGLSKTTACPNPKLSIGKGTFRVRFILLDHIIQPVRPGNYFRVWNFVGVFVDQNSLILILYPPKHTALSIFLIFSTNYFKKLWCQGAYKTQGLHPRDRESPDFPRPLWEISKTVLGIKKSTIQGLILGRQNITSCQEF